MPSVKQKIKVLVVDDSFLIRQILSDIISKDSRMEIIGVARDGKDAIEKVQKLKPDVVTMDVNMPEMDGKNALRRIMINSPVPVIMLSAFTTRDADLTLECLRLGAVDFIEKPSGEISINLADKSEEILDKIAAAATIVMDTDTSKKEGLDNFKDLFRKIQSPKKIVVIATSTGGPMVLEEIITQLDSEINVPVVVAQHMPEMFIKKFTERLGKISRIKVQEANLGEELMPGIVYILPGDYDTEIKLSKSGENSREVFSFLRDPVNKALIYPSADKLFDSAAEIYKDGTLAFVLSGMGADGTLGAKAIKLVHGMVFVQDKKSAMIYGMPQEVLNKNLANGVLSPKEIVKTINFFGSL